MNHGSQKATILKEIYRSSYIGIEFFSNLSSVSKAACRFLIRCLGNSCGQVTWRIDAFQGFEEMLGSQSTTIHAMGTPTDLLLNAALSFSEELRYWLESETVQKSPLCNNPNSKRLNIISGNLEV